MRAIGATTIKGIYFVYFMAFGSYAPYVNPYFKQIGLNGTQIGLLMAVPPLASMISPPLAGAFADLTGRRRDVLRTLMVAAALGFVGMLNTQAMPGLLTCMIMYGLFYSPLVPMLDSITFDHLGERRELYGTFRVWGSLGFIVGALFVGLLVPRIGLQSWMYVYIAAVLAAFLITSRLPTSAGVVMSTDGVAPRGVMPGTGPGVQPGRQAFRRAIETLRSMGGNLKQAFAQPNVRRFLPGVFLAYFANVTYYTFFSIYLGQLGVRSNWIWVPWAIGVASEILMMVISSRLMRHLGPKGLFCVGTAGAALRWYLYSAAGGLAPIMALQLLHSLSFGAVHVGAVNLMNQSVPSHLRSSAQSLLNATSAGLAVGVGAIVMGRLADVWGIRALFQLSAGLSAAACLYVLFSIRAARPVTEPGQAPAGAAASKPAAADRLQ